MVFSAQFRLDYRDIAVAVGILLLAFVLRVWVTLDRAQSDPFFDPLPQGTDQQVYLQQAEEFTQGTWPREPFQWQPGFTYTLIGLRALVGTTIGQMSLGTALLGAWSCGLMVGVGWLVTRRRWGGYLAGFLMAVYPVGIFFSTVLLTEGLATIQVIAFLFLIFWQRERLTVWRTVLLGLLLGYMTITRTNLALLILAWGWMLWLLAPRHWRLLLLHGVLTLALMAAAIAPVTLWNRYAANGNPYPLITTTGWSEVYRANNRDATGIRSTDPAYRLADDGPQQALLSDIRRDPLRFIELQLRKAGLYWSAAEPGNNVDYVLSGENASPLLRLIPLDFGLVAILGWAGTLFLCFPLYRSTNNRRTTGLILALIHLLIFIGVMPLWAEGRLKQPAIPPLLVATAYLIAEGSIWLRAHHWNIFIRRILPLTGLLVLLYGGLLWSRETLPQQRPIAALPSDSRPLDLVFDDTLEFIGWRTLPEWPAAEQGWSVPQRSYVVEVFWRLRQPTDQEYSMFLAVVLNGERLAGYDRAIGTVSFQPHPTTQWQPQTIYSEIIGFQLPRDLPTEQTGTIRLGVYLAQGEPGDPNRQVNPVSITSLPDQPTSIALQSFALADPVTLGQAGLVNAPVTVSFGDQIGLLSQDFPSAVAANAPLTFTMQWSALSEMSRDYTVFIHLVNADGDLAAQADSQPRQNTFLTSTWPPDYSIPDRLTLTAPEVPGIYQVYIGWYDLLADFARLPVTGPDNRYLLGTVEVTGG
jgi:4-amino-4-deoxy-L-arabinose transferase-like glycosyltransferase